MFYGIKKMEFEERQSFSKNWLIRSVLILLFLIFIVLGYGVVRQTVFGQALGSKPSSNTVLVIILLLSALLFWWLMQLKLITQVNETGVSLYFSSLRKFKREIPFSSIENVEIVDYSGYTEHGGWGWRRGSFGVAYTVYGNKAVKFTMKANEKPPVSVYVGSQRAGSLAEAIGR